MDCNPPTSSVHEIFQARIPEQIAISYSRGSSLLDLLQADGTKELLLVRHGTQVPIEEPAALGVAHGHGLPILLPTVLKLDVQVSHCNIRQDSESPAPPLCLSQHSPAQHNRSQNLASLSVGGSEAISGSVSGAVSDQVRGGHPHEVWTDSSQPRHGGWGGHF